MFCPNCRAEYREGFLRCAECDVALVHELPAEDHSATPHVTVIETSSASEVPVIKSLLEGAEIPYFTEGDSMMNLFPSEAAVTIMQAQSHGELRFKVPADRAEEARALLEEDPKIETLPDELRDGDPPESSEPS